MAVEQLALERGEEALAQRVVVRIAYRAHRGAHAGLPTAQPEGDGGVLAALIGVMDDVVRLPTQLVETIPVGDVPGDPALRRCALHLALDVGGQDLDLIAVHLSSRLPYAPPMQLRSLRRRLPPPDRRAVIVGDFNLWGPAVSALLPGWRRAVRGRTWPAHRPHSQIDHVLVRHDVDVVDAAVLDEVGSDHRPVRVTLRPV